MNGLVCLHIEDTGGWEVEKTIKNSMRKFNVIQILKLLITYEVWLALDTLRYILLKEGLTAEASYHTSLPCSPI